MNDPDGMTGWWCVGCETPKITGPRPGIACPACGHRSVSTAPFSSIGHDPSPPPETPTLSELMPGTYQHPS